MPFDNPTPDFERLRKVLLRQGEPDHVPFVELFADREIIETIIGEPIPMLEALDREMQETVLRRIIRFWYETGYDYVTVDCPLALPINYLVSEDTAADLSRGFRAWVIDLGHGPPGAAPGTARRGANLVRLLRSAEKHLGADRNRARDAAAFLRGYLRAAPDPDRRLRKRLLGAVRRRLPAVALHRLGWRVAGRRPGRGRRAR